MKIHYTTTKEEFEIIEKAVTHVLSLWEYQYIQAFGDGGRKTSMNKEAFFEALKDELNVEE